MVRYPTIHEIICDKGNPITYSIAELPRWELVEGIPNPPVPGMLMTYLNNQASLHAVYAFNFPEWATQFNAIMERIAAMIAAINQLPITDGP